MSNTNETASRDAAEIVDLVASTGLLTDGRPVLVMLSGGRDSVCLLDLAVRIAGARVVRAMHVNYGLRAAAEGDQRHCEGLCEQMGVELDVSHPHRPDTGNLQAWAREVRYARAAELAGGTDIATGHTATDQVETILYRLASSPSRRALLGMKEREGAVIRPLLGVSRGETAGYCRARNLSWREDETNESDAYARNRVRNRLLPALRDIHPGAERNILMLAEILRDEAAALDDLVDAALAGGGQVEHGGGEIELAALRELPIAVSRLVVQRLADAATGGPAPGTARRVGEILAMRDAGTAHLDLPHGVRATARDGVLSFTNTLARQ